MNLFFAVTVSRSLYRVEVLAKSGGIPTVTKIALRGESGVPVGATLDDGTLLSVGKRLIMFFPSRDGLEEGENYPQRDIARVAFRHFGGCSTEVVALFLQEKTAQKCLKARKLCAVDLRWRRTTKRTLAKIGPKHRSFLVATDQEFGLFPGERLFS